MGCQMYYIRCSIIGKRQGHEVAEGVIFPFLIVPYGANPTYTCSVVDIVFSGIGGVPVV